MDQQQKPSQQNSSQSDLQPQPENQPAVFRRRILFVSYREQLKIVFFGVFLNLIVFFFLYAVSSKSLDFLFQQFHDQLQPHLLESAVESFYVIRGYQNLAFLIAFFVSLASLFVTSVLLSHRIVGPIYKLTKHLRELNEHSPDDPKFQTALSRVQLRKDDFFKDLAHELNRFVEKHLLKK